MLRLRPLVVLLSLALALCLLGLWSARSQTGALRRVTNTTDDGVNVNPSLSGDGRRIAFESTKDLAGAGGNGFHALRADLSSDPATFIQMGVTRAPAPGISQDGSIIAFASKDDPLGTNADGNSEIFLYNGTTLRQITNTTPATITERTRQGNFQPSLSDDGRFIAFSSNRNLAGQNADGNLEIFIFDTTSNAFTQLTNTTGAVGASDAKISGNGARVAYIRDANALPAVQHDLVLQDRAGSTTRILASNVTNLAFTYGRAISDDGLRIVYSAGVATGSSQVFLFDGRTTNTTRQITSLGERDLEVPLHPTISGDGTRIAFATRRPVLIIDDDADNSIDLFTYDIPTGQFARVTDAPATADGFDGSNRAAEVVSSLSDDGSIIAFNFPRSLSDDVDSSFDNNSEIYSTGTTPRPAVGALQVLNGASFGHEPATTEAVAPDSIAVARGGALSFTTEQTQRQPGGGFPRNVGGTTVTVNGRSAQIFFVSPGQVNFHVPVETELGTAEVIVTNVEGFQSRGTIQVLRGAPGIFTISGDGLGEGMILNADTLQPGPFDPSSGQLRLIIFATGVRKATQVTATAGGRALTVESVTENPNMPGMDEVRVLVPADLRGVGPVDLVIRADTRDSNPVTVIFAGPCSDIVVNELLADPPDGLAGDANRDGVRDSAQDEFIELVNRSGIDKDISGYQLTARSTSSTTDTVRHTFAPGTIFVSGTAIVIFGGGGNFNPADPAFGGALVLKASSGSLSLTNAGGVITLREPSQAIVTVFSYGGSTGLNGDANQSLTRSPDAGVNPSCPGFVLHSTVLESGGRPFSPGTRINGTPFTATAIARIEVLPATATIDNGAKQQFTATAYDSGGNAIPGVIFFWQSSNEAVATIDQTGLATSLSPGMTEIRASARGVQSAPAILTVREVVRVLTSVEVTPNPATIPVGGTQQFTARGLDQFGNEITGLTFTWESTNTNVATIDPATGLATAVNQGQTTIRATSQGVTGTATLNVTPPTVIINEVLADPPDGLAGDANHDGVRDSGDDEFVELVNSTSGGINISGWTIRTRATTGGTESVRHTFAANTTLPASEAIVVFGGGNPNPANGVFACAQVVTASSGGLSLTNSGLTIIVKDSAGNLVAQFTYGGSTGLNADSNQSLTRSPDITGSFRTHTTATGNGGRLFSPGTRVDGTPFGSCPSRLTSVTIAPPSASILVGQTQQFTAQAFNQFGQPMTGVTITFASDNTSVATVGTVTTDPGTGIATVIVTGQAPGTAHITATATDGTTTINSSQATLTVNASAPTANLTINDVTQNEGNAGTTTFTFTVSLSAPAPTGGVTFDIATADGTAQDDNPATEDNDYVPRSLTAQTIPAGQQTYTFDVSVNGDTVVEANETFLVNVTNVIGANVTDGQGTGTITNDDAPPASTVVISQIYGGGGNVGASFNCDYVELFNRGTSTVDFAITPFSVQYASAAGNFGSTANGNKTDLTTGTIAPGKYFLVKGRCGANGAAFTADFTPATTTTGLDMAAGAGKVALVNSMTPLTAASCPTDSTIVDLVGYGTTASCFEGSGPAPTPSATNADFRKSGGCIDTNDNAADFLAAAPNPRNSSSPLNDCTAPPTPNITINDVTVTEGNSGTINATFTVTLSAASTSNVTVDFATADGTATAGSDYQSNSGTLTFTPGQTTRTIDVAVIGDTMDEPSETFFVNLTNAANGVILDNQGQGTITDNDAQPTLSINDTSVTEGDGGTTSATFTVTLSAASGFTVTVNYATADGTATAGSDYQSTNGTLTFNPGQTTQTITVLINGDTTFEPNETFFVNLSAPASATVVDAQGQGTITNDDAAPPIPAITINDVSVTEGDSGTKTVNFTVSLSMNPTQPVTVDYATASAAPASGVATAGTDYQTTSGTLTFNPGETSKPVTVTIIGDTLIEPDETFFVNLSNQSANAAITDSQGVGTITNDDTANLVISQVYGGGNNSGAPYRNDFIEIFNRGTTTVNFAVTNYSVQYASVGTGASGNFGTNKTDLTSGTVAPGQYFLIQEAGGATNGIALPTPDAIGSITMSNTSGKVALVVGTTALPVVTCPGDDGSSPFNPNNSVIADFVGYGDAAGTAGHCYEGAGPAPAPSNTTADFRKAGGCLDTDQNATDFLVSVPAPRNTASPPNDCSGGLRPEITINDRALSESTTPVTFTVTLSTASTLTVTVDYATADGTATAGVDYQPTSGTLTFAPGETTKTINVTIISDTLDEANETYFVNLSNASNGTILDNQGQGTINDNDNAPTLSINDASVSEGDSGTKTLDFTVTLSAASGQTVTVDYATANDTATAGTDYQAAAGTLTFNPGDTTETISVTINGDTVVEPDETFFVNLTNASNATAPDPQGVGTITNDDITPSISISDVTLSEGNAGTTAFTFTVTLSPASTQTVTVDYATADGTATAPGDYTAITTTQLSFAPGETSKQVTVQVNGDTDVEGDETFFVNLSNPTNATITDNQGVGTITNDDAVVASADLSVTKTDSPDPVAIGNDITYTITVTNGGTDTAVNAVLSDTVPTNTTFRSITPASGWTCPTQPAVGGTGAISCTNAGFGVGSAVFTLVVRVGTAVAVDTVISNTASVSSSTTDPNSGNNSATQTTVVKQPSLVISQIYPGGGNGGATYTNDFIEIFNRGTTTIDFSVTPYSVQYTGATGNFGGTGAAAKTDITSGTIGPGQYFLIQGASGGVNGVPLPTPDATGSIALSATAGKVALVLGTAALPADDCPGDDNVAPFNPNNATIADFVGYGSTATCYEGAGPAPFSTSTAGGLDPDARSTIRTSSCTDTNVNSADFSNPTTAPTARNKATPASPCP